MFEWVRAGLKEATRITGDGLRFMDPSPWLRARQSPLSHGLTLISSWLSTVRWIIDTKFIPLAQQAYGINEVVYACIRLLSQSVPEAPLVAYRANEETGDKDRIAYNHPLSRLIKKPNRLMTEYEFWELTTIHMAIVGRSTWWKQRNNLGEVMALWPLRPDRVGPLYSDSQTQGEEVLRGWIYQVPGSGVIVELKERDVLAFNFPDPTGESGGILEGFGPVQALARQVAADNEATKFVGALLANYAAPTVALKVKRELRDEQEARLVKAHFRNEFGGANRGTPALLDAETEVQVIGFNLQELEFPELREIAESRIASTLGVPAILVGIRVGLKLGNNRASITEQRAYFAETTLSNYWRRYQDQYTEDVAREFGEDIVCEFDTAKVRALAGQIADRLKPIRDAFEHGGATRNEYRHALGLPAVIDGNIYLVPQSMVESPANDKPTPALIPASTRPLNGEEEVVPAAEDGVPPDGKKPEVALGPAGQEPAASGAETVKAVNDSAKGGEFETFKVAPDDPQSEAEKKLAAILGALLAEWLPKASAAIADGEPFDYAGLRASLRKALEPQLVSLVVAQIEREGAESGIGMDPAEASAMAMSWVSAYLPTLLDQLLNTTQKAMLEAIARYQEGQIGSDELLVLLAPAFGDNRSELIGITETTNGLAQAVAIYGAWLGTQGIIKQAVFHTAKDERVCPLCGPREGARQGEVGFAYPPLHGRCRCWVSLQANKP